MRVPLLLVAVLPLLTLLYAPPTFAEGARDPLRSTFQVAPPDGFPAHYARVIGWRPLYASLDDALVNRVRRRIGGPDFWVTVHEGADVNGQRYYRTGYGWMRGEHLSFSGGTTLRGVDLTQRPDERLAMVYWPVAEVRHAPGGSGQLLGHLEGYDVVGIKEEQWVDGELWYRVEENQWVKSRYFRHLVGSAAPPAGIDPADRWIEIDLSEQLLVAHEGSTPVFATIISSGAARTPTVTGLFRIWRKYVADRMQGGWSTNDPYDLADVPWTMYFYRNYALHSAYWHDAFGEVRSHGCVNLSPADAKWLFDWSGPTLPEGATTVDASSGNPGTWVWVHP